MRRLSFNLSALLPFKSKKSKVPEQQHGEFSFPSLVDNALNEGIEFHSDYFIQQVGVGQKKYGRSFFIKPSGYPRTVRIGWLEGLFKSDDVNVSIHVEPFDRAEAGRQLKSKLDDFETITISAAKQGNQSKIDSVNQQVDDAKELKQQIQNNMNSLHFASISALVYADTLEELNEKSVAIERNVAAESIELVNSFDRQKAGFLSTQPLGANYLENSYRNLDENSLAGMFPHNSSTLNHTGGMPIGVYNNEYIYFNNFDDKLNNFSMGIFGIAGAGKGVLVKQILGRGFADGIEKCVIMDVEPEYVGLTYALGGIVVEIKSDCPGKHSRINPLDIYVERVVENRYTVEEYISETVNVNEKVKEAIEFFKVMKETAFPKEKDLTPYELDALDKILKKLYSNCGITEDPESLYEHIEAVDEHNGFVFNRHYKKMPTISDVHSEVKLRIEAGEKETLQSLYSVISLFVKGGAFGMFDCQTEIRDDQGNLLSQTALDTAPIVNFDISRLSKNGIERPLAQHVLMTWIWNRFILNDPKPKKRVIQDEAWMMLNYPSMMEFFKTISARGRKWNVSLTLVSQRYEMFHRTDEARDVIAQLETIAFMKQSDQDIEKILEAFRFSDEVGEVIKTADTGDVVMKVGKEIVYFRSVPTDSEWHYINTNMNKSVDTILAGG